jgi:hypothetical protein
VGLFIEDSSCVGWAFLHLHLLRSLLRVLNFVFPSSYLNYRNYGRYTRESYVSQESCFGGYGAWLEAAGRWYGIVRYVTSIPLLEYVNVTKTNCLIATLGYKQELRRHYSTVEIFAVAFSIMGLLPSIASTLSFSMPAGPVGMVWVSNMYPINCVDLLLTDF